MPFGLPCGKESTCASCGSPASTGSCRSIDKEPSRRSVSGDGQETLLEQQVELLEVLSWPQTQRSLRQSEGRGRFKTSESTRVRFEVKSALIEVSWLLLSIRYMYHVHKYSMFYQYYHVMINAYIHIYIIINCYSCDISFCEKHLRFNGQAFCCFRRRSQDWEVWHLLVFGSPAASRDMESLCGDPRRIRLHGRSLLDPISRFEKGLKAGLHVALDHVSSVPSCWPQARRRRVREPGGLGRSYWCHEGVGSLHAVARSGAGEAEPCEAVEELAQELMAETWLHRLLLLVLCPLRWTY